MERKPGGAPTDATRSAPQPSIPGGRYHIVERLSTGAIGAVYKALDTILDRPVAVKCIHLDTPLADQSPDELRERFVREARIAARLQHPNIVTIHDIVATSDRGFIIMEFIEGQSLDSLLSGRKRLSLESAIRVVSQLASALDYAHGRQVVHRDVKPVNVLVSPSLWVWVTDFGIAKSELSTNLTMAGGVVGAPDYMSPEQAKGEEVDARSDLFSLGCILFECVTGEKPFRSPSLTGVLLSIINDEPIFPLNWRSLGLPNGLKAILHHALEKNPAKRFASGEELVQALNALGTPAEMRAGAGAAPRGAEAPAEAPLPPPDDEEDRSVSGASSALPGEDLPAREERSSEPETGETLLLGPAAEEEPAFESGTGSDGSPEQTMVFTPEQREVAAPAPSVDPARVEELKREARPLRLSPNLSGELQGVEISPEEGFLLSRIDGLSRASEILAVSPMPELETAAALLKLLDKELIRFGGASASRQEKHAASTKGAPDEATVQELDRLLGLAKRKADRELLGIAENLSASARKSAYLKLIGRFHPDKFPRASDEIRGKLSRICAEAAEALDRLENPPPAVSSPGPPRPSSAQAAPGGAPANFDKRRYARELYDRALRAFDLQDFWEAIQLGRQALEADDSQAEYFHLLGRALMQNKKWRREAADSFRRASELDPANLEYLGMLGAIYRAEGLHARANAVLKKAQTLDPGFTLPAIDGEVAIEAS